MATQETIDSSTPSQDQSRAPTPGPTKSSIQTATTPDVKTASSNTTSSQVTSSKITSSKATSGKVRGACRENKVREREKRPLLWATRPAGRKVKKTGRIRIKIAKVDLRVRVNLHVYAAHSADVVHDEETYEECMWFLR